MKRLCRSTVVIACVLGCAAAATRADQPKISNARLETRSASDGLESAYRSFLSAQSDPAWMAYSVPAVPGHHPLCCGDGWSDDERESCGRCSLESDGESNHTVRGHAPGVEHLEGPQEMVIFLRAADHRVTRIRVLSPGCEVDAGGLRVLWLSDVKPSESVALLAALAPPGFRGEGESRNSAHSALAAIAMHADPAADRALDSFTTPDQPDKLREQASFWMGAARGAAGLRALERMAKTDPSSHVRSQVAFGYSISHEPAALDDMIRMAHDDENEHVRGQALFWLAQKAGKRATQAITEAIENDPDTAIKRSAVFALSQLPHDEGVPLLIQVARSNKNSEVRKQAFFWLGQSKDPCALAFFEEVLRR
ncbi:MAG TPA: HEAT repeat domain-containing protein [Candidatus Acidoferrales bacterium]|nr:HEAT repeat domain-containing protein [Candidatus Acidoferrales bacterium]